MSLSAEQKLFELCATHGGTEAMMLAQEVVDALDASRAQATQLWENLGNALDEAATSRAQAEALAEDLTLLHAAASTPLNPLGGFCEDRCRLCYAVLPKHAAGCLVSKPPASLAAYRKGLG